MVGPWKTVAWASERAEQYSSTPQRGRAGARQRHAEPSHLGQEQGSRTVCSIQQPWVQTNPVIQAGWTARRVDKAGDTDFQ